MTSHLALYRRYRPGTFAEVVGQPQVTEPLSRALATDRVGHAYLFSGPRGCGKTTSARILARSLNCESGPTPTPCGHCRSCVELAPGGPGSVDVVEIDAASHGKVDDTRDLRERAFFAPVAARRKVYIIDEAHMVSKEGFNALLKVVEEPPEHLTFIFATTEPDKVLATIRSRTHHYPFRLIAPRILTEHLASIAAAEHLPIEPAALALVVRAGGGSARDALSVLDQLMAGAGPEGITYDEAVSLLGYTPESLLDRIVDALAAYDGADVFAAVGQVVDGGQDPRRFAEDLLRRLRDLVVLGAVPGSGASILLDVPPETVDRLVAQHARFGQAHALRAAELVDAGLTEIRGATAPRLHLELLLARLLLPAADGSDAGFAARLERIERRLAAPAVAAPAVAAPASHSEAAGAAGWPGSAPGSPGRPPDLGPTDSGRSAARPSGPRATAAPEPPSGPSAPTDQPGAGAEEPSTEDRAVVEPTASTTRESALPPPSAPPAAAGTERPERVDRPDRADRATPPPAAPPVPGTLGLPDLRKLWDDVLDDVKSRSRIAHAALLGSQVIGIDAGRLTVSFANEGMRTNFTRGNRAPMLHAALHSLLALDVAIDTVVGAGTTAMAPEAAGSPGRGSSRSSAGGPDHPGGPDGDARGARDGSDGLSGAGSPTGTGAAVGADASGVDGSDDRSGPRSNRAETSGTTTANGHGTRHDGGGDGSSDRGTSGTGSATRTGGSGPAAAGQRSGGEGAAGSGRRGGAGGSGGRATAGAGSRAGEGAGDGWPVAAVPGGPGGVELPPVAMAPPPSEEDEIGPDDADLDDPGISGRELLTRELGAEVIAERAT